MFNVFGGEMVTNLRSFPVSDEFGRSLRSPPLNYVRVTFTSSHQTVLTTQRHQYTQRQC